MDECIGSGVGGYSTYAFILQLYIMVYAIYINFLMELYYFFFS